MPRRSSFKGSGKNDVWFAAFCIAAVIIVSLLANARDTHGPERPAPVPASQIKE
ncbi:MAG: hypothetical protein JWR59_1350 [Brevundimonas sp.]|nr:hypothetical protein [Brevundimonas sp.]